MQVVFVEETAARPGARGGARTWWIQEGSALVEGPFASAEAAQAALSGRLMRLRAEDDRDTDAASADPIDRPVA